MIKEWEELFRRWICSWWGHNWQGDERGAPVVPYFVVCLRCGKWARAVKP